MRMINDGDVFHEWANLKGAAPWILQRRDASKVNIGNAVEDLFDTTPMPLFVGNALLFYQYDNKWVYLNQDQYENMLIGWLIPSSYAAIVASGFPEGVYFKVNFIGNGPPLPPLP